MRRIVLAIAGLLMVIGTAAATAQLRRDGGLLGRRGGGVMRQARDSDPTLVEHRLTVGGVERTYSLYVPPHRAGPRPLVIMLHGGGGNGQQFARQAGFVAKAAKEGFILALPDGTSRMASMGTWNAVHCCAYAMKQGVDDVAFLRTVIDEIQRTQSVDATRIYLGGMSNGGMMTHRAAITLGDRLAAAMVGVGALFGDEPQPTAPVPMLLVNAENDESVPVAGGMGKGVVRSAQSAPFKPSRYAADFWARADGCADAPEASETADYWRTRWSGCRGGAEVDFYVVKDAEHGWPGAKPALHRDRPTGRVDATELMWAFFAHHHR